MEPPASPKQAMQDPRLVSVPTAGFVWGLYNFAVLLTCNQEHQKDHFSQDLVDLALSHIDSLSPDQLLFRNPSAWRVLWTIMFTSSTNINSNLLLRLSVQCCCHTISLTSSLLFSPASLCASLYCFWISFLFEFWFLSVEAVLPFYSFLFASLSTFCMSCWHSSPFLILLTQSGAVLDLTVHLRSSLSSLAHTFSDSVSPAGLLADHSWHLS